MEGPIIVAIALFVLILIGREVTCWYFKINRTIEILEKINRNLDVLADRPASEVDRPASETVAVENRFVLTAEDQAIGDIYNKLTREGMSHRQVVTVLHEGHGYSKERIQAAFRKNYELQQRL